MSESRSAAIPGVTHEQIPTNGIELHVATAGPADGKPVVLCHGFPELWYSWRHQITALADAGYRVMAPDLRGYGASSAPKEVTAYGSDQLTADLGGLLDHYGYEQAHFTGHDWGAMVVWEMGRLHPDRVSSLYNMSVPYSQAPAPPTRDLRGHLRGQVLLHAVLPGGGAAREGARGRHPPLPAHHAVVGRRVRASARAAASSRTCRREGTGFIDILTPAARPAPGLDHRGGRRRLRRGASGRAGSSGRSASTATWTPTGSAARTSRRRSTPCRPASSPVRSTR